MYSVVPSLSLLIAPHSLENFWRSAHALPSCVISCSLILDSAVCVYTMRHFVFGTSQSSQWLFPLHRVRSTDFVAVSDDCISQSDLFISRAIYVCNVYSVLNNKSEYGKMGRISQSCGKPCLLLFGFLFTVFFLIRGQNLLNFLIRLSQPQLETSSCNFVSFVRDNLV